MTSTHLQSTHVGIETSIRTLADHSKPIFYGLLATSLLIYLLTTALHRIRNLRPRPRPNTPNLEKPTISHKPPASLKTPPRPQGTWPPVPFTRPAASPYPNFDVHKTEPIPYRPFRYGPYHITMGLRTMKWDEWIELDNQYLKFHADKARRIRERGERCCRTAPEAYEGAVELLEEL